MRCGHAPADPSNDCLHHGMSVLQASASKQDDCLYLDMRKPLLGI